MINSKKKGFTIVELVIVVAVIAILAAVLIPTFSNLVKKANESADIQAVRNMNVYLAQAEATEGVNSILDVYEIFDESDYVVENYQPLYKGRYFFYDKQKNQILYVDEGGQVLFPADSKGDAQGTNDWFSLSMKIEKKEVSPTESVENGVTTITYNINTAEQYYYVSEKLNSGEGNNKVVVINVLDDVDFKGASICIDSTLKMKSLTIQGIEGKQVEMRNITQDSYTLVSNANSDNEERPYNASGIVGEVEDGHLVIKNIKFVNVNVKDMESGNAALLVGCVQGTSTKCTLENISIEESTVIGHRSVGSLIGFINNIAENDFNVSGIKLNNVSVKTIAGRAGLIYGNSNEGNLDLSGIEYTNSTLGIYECDLIISKVENKTKGNAKWEIKTEGRLMGFDESALYSRNSGYDIYK